LLTGPAINRWASDVSTVTAVAPGDGNVTLACKVTSLGGGQYHYEYALHNYDSFREVQKITIPVGLNTAITNIGFHDADFNPSDDWTMTLAGGNLSWETTPFASDSVNSNALTFGYLMNFRFDANVPAIDGNATLQPWRPGTASTPTPATKVPDFTMTS